MPGQTDNRLTSMIGWFINAGPAWLLVALMALYIILGDPGDGTKPEPDKPTPAAGVNVEEWISDVPASSMEHRGDVADLLDDIADRAETGELKTRDDISNAVLAGYRNLPWDVGLDWSAYFSPDLVDYFNRMESSGSIDDQAISHVEELRSVAEELRQ